MQPIWQADLPDPSGCTSGDAATKSVGPLLHREKREWNRNGLEENRYFSGLHSGFQEKPGSSEAFSMSDV